MGYNRVLGHFTNSQELANQWQSGQEYLVDQITIHANFLYICLVNHTAGASFAVDLAAGKWTVLNPTSPGGSIPVGTVTQFAGSVAPAGYLICDGSPVPNGVGIIQGVTADYSALYAVVNAPFSGNLPDLRGVFVRGAGTNGTMVNANGAAYSATLGATQNDQMQGHRHSGTFYGQTGSGIDSGPTFSNILLQVGNPSSDGTNGTPRTGVETRPANVGLNYIIKY